MSNFKQSNDNFFHISMDTFYKKINKKGSFASHAVLIPIFKDEDDTLQMIFQKRSQYIKQPGDISFPGGKIEPLETSINAAIRETCEELNIHPDKIHILGKIQSIYRVNGLNLSVYVATLDIKSLSEVSDYNKCEIETLFSVPLDYFMKTAPEKYHINTKFDFPSNFPFDRIENGKNYGWHSEEIPIYFYQYENYTIWGMTAEMIVNLTGLLREE